MGMARPVVKHADIKDMTFERALKELESIVERLEKGAVELEGPQGARTVVQAPAFFGEEALTGEPRVDTARVRDLAELVVVPGTNHYTVLLGQNPKVKTALRAFLKTT